MSGAVQGLAKPWFDVACGRIGRTTGIGRALLGARPCPEALPGRLGCHRIAWQAPDSRREFGVV